MERFPRMTLPRLMIIAVGGAVSSFLSIHVGGWLVSGIAIGSAGTMGSILGQRWRAQDAEKRAAGLWVDYRSSPWRWVVFVVGLLVALVGVAGLMGQADSTEALDPAAFGMFVVFAVLGGYLVVAASRFCVVLDSRGVVSRKFLVVWRRHERRVSWSEVEATALVKGRPILGIRRVVPSIKVSGQGGLMPLSAMSYLSFRAGVVPRRVRWVESVVRQRAGLASAGTES